LNLAFAPNWTVIAALFAGSREARAAMVGGAEVHEGTARAVPRSRPAQRQLPWTGGQAGNDGFETVDIKPVGAQFAQAVEGAQALLKGGAAAAAGGGFADAFGAALQSVSKRQLQASELQNQFQLENPAVSLEQTMIAMNTSNISLRAALQVRNKLVQAYEQIMQMPV
jgi:flagellar hook-basal body complex protein FliE